ncbi:CMT1A duplicated region transcript 4 protein homolog [Python bivittatus]|uniref:CMT1A duplicated region transcript 4 protein homolog n=1 Tax=Python bivittatus TaxID=176946 RepID=A0A9F5IAP0_PYTBI|nr:CMT1A duplicated region transcript 4 protein homolog [Python bivittatus]
MISSNRMGITSRRGTEDILQPSQRDSFDQLTRMQSTTDVSFKNMLKDRSYTLGNIGIPSHLIHVHHWPAYTTHISPMVKKFIEQDKSRIATFLETTHLSSLAQHHKETSQDLQKKPSPGSEEAEAAEPSPAGSQFSATVSFCWAQKDSLGNYGGLGVPGSFLPLGPAATGNLVIFAKKKNPLRVLPMKLPDVSQRRKNKGSCYTKFLN